MKWRHSRFRVKYHDDAIRIQKYRYYKDIFPSGCILILKYLCRSRFLFSIPRLLIYEVIRKVSFTLKLRIFLFILDVVLCVLWRDSINSSVISDICECHFLGIHQASLSGVSVERRRGPTRIIQIQLQHLSFSIHDAITGAIVKIKKM